MIYPRIHRSGWNGPSIRAEHNEVVQALSDAIAAFSKINFDDGRGYYSPHFIPPDTTPGAIARVEHMSRLNRLVSIRAELEDIVANIDEQMLPRSLKEEA